RFFAQYDLSSLSRSHGYRGVQRVRHSYIDDLDVFPTDNRPPIGFNFFPAPLRRRGLQLRAIAPTDNLQVQAIRKFEEISDLMKGVGRHLCDESRTNHG